MSIPWNHMLNWYSWHTADDVTEIPFVTSFFYYALTAMLGRVLRLAVKNSTSIKPGSFLQLLLYDFITTFQLMAMSLENGQFRKHYGNTTYVIVLLATGIWTFNTIKDGFSNPCSCMVDIIKGAYGYKSAIIRVLIQLFGGLLSYQYARLFWALGMTTSHTERFAAIYCRSDLRVTTLMGFAIEFSATFVNSIICFNTFSSFRNSENLSKCLFGSYLTILGIDLTGMYLNPINATNQTFGCHGPWLIEFILVYWVAPLLATALAVRAQHELKTIIKHISFDSSPDAVSSKQTGSNNNDKSTSILDKGALGLRRAKRAIIKKRNSLKQKC